VIARARHRCVAVRPALVSFAVSLAIPLATAPAAADMTKRQCVEANGKGQELRRTGKLSAASVELRACTDPSCPALVRADCTKRLEDVEEAQPTIAFEVKDPSGSDVVAVKVTVDGAPLTEKLDGTALPVDPGQHVFTFEATGQPPVSRTLVVTEGVKGRGEVVQLGAADHPAPTPATPLPQPSTTEPSSTSTPAPAPGPGGMPTVSIVGLGLGGLGVAGLVVASVFGEMTLTRASAQKNACSSPMDCTNHASAVQDRSTGLTDGAISTAGFALGGALLAGGAVLFFVGRRSGVEPGTTGVLVVPSVGPGGGGMTLRGEF
jgi:hypothetical protein